MTDNQRMQWLAERGWHHDASMGLISPALSGKYHWVDGPDNKTLYVRDTDGAFVILGGPKELGTWEQLQDLVEGRLDPVKKYLPGQKSLFD